MNRCGKLLIYTQQSKEFISSTEKQLLQHCWLPHTETIWVINDFSNNHLFFLSSPPSITSGGPSLRSLLWKKLSSSFITKEFYCRVTINGTFAKYQLGKISLEILHVTQVSLLTIWFFGSPQRSFRIILFLMICRKGIFKWRSLGAIWVISNLWSSQCHSHLPQVHTHLCV